MTARATSTRSTGASAWSVTPGSSRASVSSCPTRCVARSSPARSSASAAERSAALPDVPTSLEAGFPNAEYPIWYGLFLPAKTPREIVDRLHRETRIALQAPKARDRLNALAVDPMVLTPREFDARVQQEIAVNAALVKSIGIKPH